MVEKYEKAARRYEQSIGRDEGRITLDVETPTAAHRLQTQQELAADT